MLTQHPNELYPQLISLSSLNPTKAHDSSPREVMFTGNLNQFLTISGSTPRRLQTGVERRFGETTPSIRFDCAAEIIRLIARYPRGIGQGAIRYNPSTIVLYENQETKEIGMLDVARFHCSHQHFGFEYKTTDVYENLLPGSCIEEGTIIADSPNVREDGQYMFGLETNVAYMSDNSVIEDGIKVSDAYLKRITPTGFGTRIISFGANHYPINLYGTEQQYKPFPDIGDHVRTDGLLFALREHDPLLSVVNMTPKALLTPDYIYDRKTYAEPDAVIVDIKVERNTNPKIPRMPVGMDEQLYKYYNADTVFYKKILDEYYALLKERRGGLKLDPLFHGLVVEAIDRLGSDYVYKDKWSNMEKLDALKVNKLFRNAPLDEWRVVITYKYHSVPAEGFKLTDCHGGKGVICSVVPEADMPIDENGNRVEVIMDDLSTTRRLNPGRFYEQYFNAASRDVSRRVRQMFGMDAVRPTEDEIDAFFGTVKNDETINKVWDYLMGYYKIISPIMVEKLNSPEYQVTGGPDAHLRAVLKDGIYIHFPAHNPIDRVDAVRQIQKHYPPFITPVTFRGMKGDMVTTKKPVLIGSMYFLVLEKTAEDWSAVASAKTHHYGTTARLTNYDKNSAPGRQNPVKTIGEAESRLMAATIGGDVVAELMDQTNNPVAHRAILRSILTADKPTDIDHVLDRDVVKMGGHRAIAYLQHLYACSGKELTRE